MQKQFVNFPKSTPRYLKDKLEIYGNVKRILNYPPLQSRSGLATGWWQADHVYKGARVGMSPKKLHIVSKNASKTEPAKLLVTHDFHGGSGIYPGTPSHGI